MYYDHQDDRDFEFNVRYDYISEAYGNLGDSREMLDAEMEAIAAEEEEHYGTFGPRVLIAPMVGEPRPVGDFAVVIPRPVDFDDIPF